MTSFRGHCTNNGYLVVKQEAPSVFADMTVLDCSGQRICQDSLTGNIPSLFMYLPLFNLYYNYLTHVPLDHRATD